MTMTLTIIIAKVKNEYILYFSSVLFSKPDDKLMKIAKIVIALHCSGDLVEYSNVSSLTYFSHKYFNEQNFSKLSHIPFLITIVLSKMSLFQMLWKKELILFKGHWVKFFGGDRNDLLLTPHTFMRW